MFSNDALSQPGYTNYHKITSTLSPAWDRKLQLGRSWPGNGPASLGFAPPPLNSSPPITPSKRGSLTAPLTRTLFGLLPGGKPRQLVTETEAVTRYQRCVQQWCQIYPRRKPQ